MNLHPTLRRYSHEQLARLALQGLVYEHKGYLLPSVSGAAAVANNFEKGVNGNSVTTAAGEGSPTKWDLATIAATCSLTYSNAAPYLGDLYADFAIGGTPGTTRLAWTTAFVAGGAPTEHYGRVYFRRESANSTNVSFICDSSLNWRIYLNTSSGLTITDLSGAGLANSASSTPLNSWCRIEWHVVHHATAGVVEARLFTDPSASTPAVPGDAISTINRNTGAAANGLSFGYVGGGVNGESFAMDGIVAGMGDWVGAERSADLDSMVPSEWDMFATWGTGAP